MKPEAGQNPTGSPALQLWLAFPGDLAEPAVDEACAALLDDAERARAARFRFDRHRREYLATHALTRVALSHAHPLPPHAWSFSVNQNGKPSPISWGGVPECGLRFNQSNSVELAVCLISRPAAQPGAAAPDAGVDVGVDVESFARAEEIVPLAARVFSAAERTQLDALPAAARPDRALSLWTLKEAYIKARGLGLAMPLADFAFTLAGPQPPVIRFLRGANAQADQWRFAQLCLSGDYQAAVALRPPGREALSVHVRQQCP